MQDVIQSNAGKVYVRFRGIVLTNVVETKATRWFSQDFFCSLPGWMRGKLVGYQRLTGLVRACGCRRCPSS